MITRTSFRVVTICLCAICCASCGPRMRTQPSIQPYERAMPQMPTGTVPTRGDLSAFTLEQSRLTDNPLPLSEKNLRNGRIYYNYYCVMCHGEDGRGNGPVGQGFVPKPTDLTTSGIAQLNAGQVYLRMLTGTGHEPVMDQTMLRDHRWPLVMYVQQLSKRVPEERSVRTREEAIEERQ